MISLQGLFNKKKEEPKINEFIISVDRYKFWIEAVPINGRTIDCIDFVSKSLQKISPDIYNQNILDKWSFLCKRPVNNGIDIKNSAKRIEKKLFAHGYKLISFTFCVRIIGNGYSMFNIYPTGKWKEGIYGL